MLTRTISRAIALLALLHIFIVISSNYLVQFPMELWGWQTTWGAFSFPFIFLATDLTVRFLGKSTARRIIGWAMLPALIASYIISALFHEGSFQGAAALLSFNSFVFRIALASFSAYVVGQLLDITVFDRLRQLPQWWVAPAASTLIGNFVDTLVFFWVAFWKSSNLFMAEHWVEIAVVDYIIKLAISLSLFLPLYGVLLNRISRYLKRLNAASTKNGI